MVRQVVRAGVVTGVMLALLLLEVKAVGFIALVVSVGAAIAWRTPLLARVPGRTVVMRYAEQLRRWQTRSLSVAQRQEVNRLASQVGQWRSAVAVVLELAEEMKDNTIEALLRKGDLEVGLEALLGQEPYRRGGGRAEQTPGWLGLGCHRAPSAWERHRSTGGGQ